GILTGGRGRDLFRFGGATQLSAAWAEAVHRSNRHSSVTTRRRKPRTETPAKPSSSGCTVPKRYLSFIDKAVWSNPYFRLSFKNLRTLLTSDHRRASGFLCVAAESIPRKRD